MKWIVFLLLGLVFNAGSCPILDSRGNAVGHLGDPLFEILSGNEACPQNVVEFRVLWEAENAVFKTTMVANRGFHNPRLGSFSFFEMVEVSSPKKLSLPVHKEELFFGHFTAIGPNQTLTLEQNPNVDSLMIELVAWDREKKVYNFYELIGNAEGPHWFYRGDSKDIWSDVQKLHLNKPGEPPFGKKLRCSGCHLAGGPIMKEFSQPHDSWWFGERPLPFGGLSPDSFVQKVMQSLQDPMELASGVAAGVSKLERPTNSPQIALRPLFCPEELQLQSSPSPLQGPETIVAVPTGFFLDERLGAITVTRADKENYLNALKKLGSRFPETNQIDGDHAWNTPVKAVSDTVAIEKLLGKQIDREFIADVLAVDMTRPVFSLTRCQLLKLVPQNWAENWKAQFQFHLSQSSMPAAKELFANLTDSKKTADFHQSAAQEFIEKCQAKLKNPKGVLELVQYLGQVRAEAFASDISKNPRGQILEPGFRVIFPEFEQVPTPFSKSLDRDCNLN